MEHSYTFPMRNTEEETIEHIFKDHWFLKRIWWISLLELILMLAPVFPETDGCVIGYSIWPISAAHTNRRFVHLL